MNIPKKTYMLLLLLAFGACTSDSQINTSGSSTQSPPPPPPPVSAEQLALEEKEKETRQHREYNLRTLINSLKSKCFVKHRGEVVLSITIKPDGQIEKYAFRKSKDNDSSEIESAIECGESTMKKFRSGLGEIFVAPRARSRATTEQYTFPL